MSWTFFQQTVGDIQEQEDIKRGASCVPMWVTGARNRGDRVRMQELEYWVNFTNRVSYERKLTTPCEWAQVKIFNLPKRILKLQVEPEHLDVFLSTVKFVRPRKEHHHKYVHIIIELDNHQIILMTRLYGRFDDSNLGEHFELITIEKYDPTFDYIKYKFKNKYIVQIFKCHFNENQ